MNSNYLHNIDKLDIITLLNTMFICIILFLHHANYTTNYFSFLFNYKIVLFLQKLAVGGFVFLSGFKLTKSKSSDSMKHFFINRFFRIYPIYLLALIVFSFTVFPHSNEGSLPTLLNFTLHALCIQAIFPLDQPAFPTIWFVSILFCCYSFYIAIRRFLKSIPLFYSVTTLIILSMFLLHQVGKTVNIVFFWPDVNIYLTIFAVGMAYSFCEYHFNRIHYRYLLSLSIIGFCGLICFYNVVYIHIKGLYNSIVQFALVLLATIPCYFVAFKIAPRLQDLALPHMAVRACKSISYASFCVFLFHRAIWTVMAEIWPQRFFYQWLFIIALGVPTIFVLCYALQRSYDRIVAYLLHDSALRPVDRFSETSFHI
jgi:peptidoglycan/LPS O-acetylase OafA/YrhL